MLVALAQTPSIPDKNRVFDLITEIVADVDAELVVFPEGVMHAFDPGIDLFEVAEPLDGEFVAGVRDLASRTRKGIVVGCWETGPEGEHRVFNTVICVNKSGELVSSYRKLHLFDSFGFTESTRVIAGDEPIIFDFEGFRFGLMTCYELRFPELARSLVSLGAGTLLVPAGWLAGEHKLDHWRTLNRARAIENTAYVLAVGLCGGMYAGHSTAVDPIGIVLDELGTETGLLTVEISDSRLREVREKIPSLEHRRM